MLIAIPATRIKIQRFMGLASQNITVIFDSYIFEAVFSLATFRIFAITSISVSFTKSKLFIHDKLDSYVTF